MTKTWIMDGCERAKSKKRSIELCYIVYDGLDPPGYVDTEIPAGDYDCVALVALGGEYDVIVAWNDGCAINERSVYLGHWNDGVVG